MAHIDAMTMQMDPAQLPPPLDGANPVSLPAGATIFEPGDPCTQFFFVLEGTIRVALTARNGRTVTLYRFGAGETCVMTTSCLLGGASYGAEANTQSAVRALVLTKNAFDTAFSQSAPFRQLVLTAFSDRLAQMMARIETIAFTPLDQRLAATLLEHLPGTARAIKLTHDDLAQDLGSAREVISRKLAQWEQDGLIIRQRGMITVTDRAALQNLSLRDPAS
ncbi:MAG: Crp/Fnr family transcriptional regulator [Pseudomonadota bacterium]